MALCCRLMAALERRMMSRPIPTSEEARQVAISTPAGATTHPMAAMGCRKGARRRSHGWNHTARCDRCCCCGAGRRAGRAHAVWGSSISVSLDWSTDWLVETSAPYAVKTSRHNNIVLILTDDQDQMLGGGSIRMRRGRTHAHAKDALASWLAARLRETCSHTHPSAAPRARSS